MKNLRNIIFFLALAINGQTHALGPVLSYFEKEWGIETDQSFTKQVEKTISDLQKRKQEAEDAYNSYKSTLEKIQKTLSNLKERLLRSRGIDLDYLNFRILSANKAAQTVTETAQLYQDMKTIFENHIKLLEEYKQDPEFKAKGLVAEQKAIYSIDDFQKVNSIVIQYQQELQGLEERLKKAQVDYEALKKNQLLARQEYDERKREQRDLKNKESADVRPEWKKLSIKQQGELLDAEERLAGFKKDLADAKIKEADAKIHLMEQSIKITKLQLEVLEKEEEHIRQELRIDKKDLTAAEAALKNQMQESARLQEDYAKRIESLNLLKQGELNQINQIKQRARLSDAELESLYSWSYQPTTVQEWQTLIDVGRLHNHIMYEIDVHKDSLQAQAEQEKAKVTQQEINALTIRSWQNLTSGAFDGYNQQELAREIKQYEQIKADIQGSLSALSDKRAAASGLLNSNAKISEAIKSRLRSFKEQKDTIFKANGDEYSRFGTALRDEAFGDAQRRGEIIAQLIELYSNLSNLKLLIIKKIEGMIKVLSAKSQWKGTPPLWKALKKFGPDIARFNSYLTREGRFAKSLIAQKKTITNTLTGFVYQPASLITFLLYILILFLVFLLLRLYLPELAQVLSRAVTPDYGFAHGVSNFLASVLHFLTKHLKGMYIWTLLMAAVHYRMVDPYLGVLFYLLSIPLWIYYVYQFIAYIKAVNSSRDYLFASKRYQQRFFLVISVLLYATVTILLLREALLLALPKLDAPRVLLALNFVLLQVSLILILAREQLLSLIPQKTPLWEWIHEHLTKYYYVFLAGIIFIIIMSNPYIGYGPNFFYAITRLLLIILLIPLLIGLHEQIKRWSGSFFFYGDDEGLKERFRHGKTTYGFFIIASFLFFTALGIIIAANIWGYAFGLEDIIGWLRKGLYGYTDIKTGRHVDVTTLHLAKVFLYVLGGVFLAYFINTFVLRRMFDLLMVNIGVQSAVLSLTRYAIVLVAIIIGLNSIGASYSLLYIFAVLGGLGVAGKEIITDFMGYFIILIQRPLKIGDLVRIDNDLQGVVRHLTLRSIVMRRNNSVTVIIPNSYIMTKPLTNWNYSRTFFAFEDMYLTVPFTADPIKVKELILSVLNNHINILKNPMPVVRLHDFTDNGFQFMVRGYLSPDKVLEQYDIASDIRLELVSTLRGAGYDVGSPTRVLRLVQEKNKDSDYLKG